MWSRYRFHNTQHTLWGPKSLAFPKVFYFFMLLAKIDSNVYLPLCFLWDMSPNLKGPESFVVHHHVPQIFFINITIPRIIMKKIIPWYYKGNFQWCIQINCSAHEFEIKPVNHLEETPLNFTLLIWKVNTKYSFFFISLYGPFLTSLSRHISLAMFYNIILFILSLLYLNQK